MLRDDQRCAPSKKLLSGTCYTIQQLQDIANYYNNIYKDDIIIFDNNTSKNRLLYRIMIKITKKTNCDNQICWLKQGFMKQHIDTDMLKNTFRPKGPSNQGNFKWLSNYDIKDVMEQYEYKYSEFKFLGAVPVDFYEINYLNLKNIDFDKLYDTTYKLGLIINLDKHDQPGSHWVSLYFNLKTYEIYFSDSGGSRPNKYIKNFIRLIANFCYKKYNSLNNKYDDITSINSDVSFMNYNNKNKYEILFPIKYNQNKLQYGSSECGVFSLNFILRLLNNESFDDYIKNPPNDDKINKCRNIYFIDENKEH